MYFKCKNCGGNVVYSPERHTMFCPFCESEKSGELSNGTSPEMTICPNCGGEITVAQHTSATQCPYCDSYLILNERVEGDYRPKLILPFQRGKEICKALIRDKFKKNLFAPTDFLSEVRLNSMQGGYVPYWLYDYDTHCAFQGEGTKVRTWTSGDTQYTETSYYAVVRDMDINFDKIPVDASEAMPDNVMDLMEPYDYSQLVDFDPEYMSGFYAEKYNMTANVVEDRARKKMSDDAVEMLKASYAGYHSVRPIRQDISVMGNRANFGLLPVWTYLYTYGGREYPFYVNGQTGKIVGEVPVSNKKVWAYTGTVWGCVTAILFMLPLLLTWL
ncbi:MAG: hypothetical protein NC517_11605 [Firmicutes bacterium]|nr:hypothetical protein [Bacillota bacterium]